MRHKLLFLMLTILTASTPATAYNFMVGGLCYDRVWNTWNHEAYVVSQTDDEPAYTNISGALIIPESVNDGGTIRKVVAIGNLEYSHGSAFAGCTGLTSVSIPNSV